MAEKLDDGTWYSETTGFRYKNEAAADKAQMDWITGKTAGAAAGAAASLPFLFGSICGNVTALMLRGGKFKKFLLALSAGFNIAVCMAMLGFLVDDIPLLSELGYFLQNFCILGLIAGAIWYLKFHYELQKTIRTDVLGTILTITYSIAFYSLLLGIIMHFIKDSLSFYFIFFGFAGAVAFYLIVFKKLTGDIVKPGKEETKAA